MSAVLCETVCLLKGVRRGHKEKDIILLAIILLNLGRYITGIRAEWTSLEADSEPFLPPDLYFNGRMCFIFGCDHGDVPASTQITAYQPLEEGDFSTCGRGL